LEEGHGDMNDKIDRKSTKIKDLAEKVTNHPMFKKKTYEPAPPKPVTPVDSEVKVDED